MANNAPALSWTRAARLVDLSGHESKNDCRSFLAQSDLDVTILDNGLDKRNAEVKAMVAAFEDWTKNGGAAPSRPRGRRKSKGDPTRSPRAGALSGIAQAAGRLIPPRKAKVDGTRIPGQALMDIRSVQQQYNLTCEDLLYCVDVIGRLLDGPVNLDNVLHEIKEGRASLCG